MMLASQLGSPGFAGCLPGVVVFDTAHVAPPGSGAMSLLYHPIAITDPGILCLMSDPSHDTICILRSI